MVCGINMEPMWDHMWPSVATGGRQYEKDRSVECTPPGQRSEDNFGCRCLSLYLSQHIYHFPGELPPLWRRGVAATPGGGAPPGAADGLLED